MKGFFTLKETQSSSRPSGRVVSCTTCGLYRDVLNPRIEAYGKGRKGILVIGEAPGEWEDKKGRPWQGKVGRKLQRKLGSLGIDLFRDCTSINSVNCRPPGNRNPKPLEIECCRPRVWSIIKEMRPKLILLFGNFAVQSFLGHRWKKDLGGITKWRGWTIPDKDAHAWVCPVFHPSYVDRAGKGSVEETIWSQDLKKALSFLDVSFPEYKDEEECIELMQDCKKARQVLKDLKKCDLFAFDYETTGLKPHKKGHKIVCVSIAVSEDKVYAFPFFPEIRGIFKRVLQNENIRKMAHNMKFEDTWSRFQAGALVRGWYWDSMLAAHILDNRPGITGLKFQVYVNFGVVDYDSDISPYLKSGSKDGNAFNQIDKAPMRSLLKYCAMDSLFEFRLARLQMKRMGVLESWTSK